MPGTVSFVQLLVIAVLNGSAVYAVRPIASYRALDLGAGPLEIGFIASSYAALSLFAALLIGRWIDGFGASRILLIGTSLVAISSVTAIWIDSIVLLALGQTVLGLGQITCLVALQTMVANDTPAEKRDGRFGLYGVAASGGQLIGPAAAGFIAGNTENASGMVRDLTPVFIVATVCALAATLLAGYRVYRAGAVEKVAGTGPRAGHLSAVRDVLARPAFGHALVASAAVVLSVDLLIAYLPALGESRSLSVQLVGLLLAIRAGGSIISRLQMGQLVDAFGRGRVLTTSMMVTGGALIALPLLSHPIALIVLMVVLGYGLGLGQPLTLAWVASLVDRDQRGTALGVRLTGMRLGQLVIPSVMGLLAGVAGLLAMFWLLAAGLMGGAAVVRHSRFDSRSESDAQ